MKNARKMRSNLIATSSFPTLTGCLLSSLFSGIISVSGCIARSLAASPQNETSNYHARIAIALLEPAGVAVAGDAGKRPAAAGVSSCRNRHQMAHASPSSQEVLGGALRAPGCGKTALRAPAAEEILDRAGLEAMPQRVRNEWQIRGRAATVGPPMEIQPHWKRNATDH